VNRYRVVDKRYVYMECVFIMPSKGCVSLLTLNVQCAMSEVFLLWRRGMGSVLLECGYVQKAYRIVTKELFCFTHINWASCRINYVC
jgi:hypothetical protein